MTEFFLNSSLREYTISDSSSCMYFFRDMKQDVSFHLQEYVDVVFAVFLNNSTINLHFFSEREWVKARVFAFIPAKSNSHSTLKVHTTFLASYSEVQVHLIAIQDEWAFTSLQGTIDISEKVEKVSWHLLEEVVLLWNSSYTSLQPILTVASPDVQASHGAKVHRIAQDKLFYMQSRGLDTPSALSLIIDSYLQQVLWNFELSDDQKTIIYSFIRWTDD